MLPVLFVLAFLTGNSIAPWPILGPIDGNSVHSEGDWSALGRHAAAFAADRRIATGEGNGPVNALDAALRKAIDDAYPALVRLHLTDFKVRVLESDRGTGAVTRVLLDTTDGERTWTTIGVSANIIEASWQALVDSIVYGLLHAPA